MVPTRRVNVWPRMARLAFDDDLRGPTVSRLVKAELRVTDSGTVDRWEHVVRTNPFVGPESDVGALGAGWTIYFEVEELPLDSIERFGGRVIDEREGEHGAELVALDPFGAAVGFITSATEPMTQPSATSLSRRSS